MFAGEISLVLGLADLVMQFREAGRRVSHRIELDGRSPAQVEAWLLVELLHRGVDRDRFSKALPYETADPLAGDGVWYDRDAHAPQLAEFAAWIANGASVLTSIASEPAQSGTKADGIAFHPEPFTLEMHVPLATGDAAAPLARIGLSAGDERRNEPYFYVTGTGTAKSAAVPIGRVITASEVLAAGQSRDWLTAKLREAVGECRARSLN